MHFEKSRLTLGLFGGDSSSCAVKNQRGVFKISAKEALCKIQQVSGSVVTFDLV